MANSRERIVQAAFEALRTKGFAGASARAIASIAEVNPGLIFYYFDTLDDLMLEALRHSNEARLEQYRSVVANASSAGELMSVLRWIYREDVESGHIRVVCELVAGSVARPELGRRVMEQMEPWMELAEEGARLAVSGSPAGALASPHELAHAAVTFYLGANLVTQLGDGPDPVEALLASAERAAGLLDALGSLPAAPK